MKPTDKYKKVFEYIYSYQKSKGYSPSVKEIRDAVGIKSLRGVTLQLDKLQRLGFIEKEKGSRRSIRILANVTADVEKQQLINVPLVGEIRAGMPTLAQENIEEYKKIPKHLLHGRINAFLLRVKGDSMTKAGYFPGDIVIVGQQNTADNGDIVVAFISDEETATLKRFKKMQDYIILLPESKNPEYKPIIEHNVTIQGKVLDKLPQELY